jgi:hypothetical protein
VLVDLLLQMTAAPPFELRVEPACPEWPRRARTAPDVDLLGHDGAAWRRKVRAELGLDTERPVIATGHQSLLWHPGILVKYLLTDAVAREHGFATANLVVDQHAGGYGEFEVPLRRRDGALGVRRIELTRAPGEVPMALHEPFVPPAPPAGVPVALPSVGEGIARIHAAIAAHRNAPNAALQMNRALADLMARWVPPMPNVTATDLAETSLARALLREMVRDPQRCAEAYNAAVAAVPDAGIGPLLVRDDYVELPLWRLRHDGRRMHAYDNDVQAWLDGGADAPRLLPRALFMTALIRLGMCDLFVHGTGGARYDRAMERWIEDWLAVQPAPIVVATATMRLPLLAGAAEAPDFARSVADAHRIWHDPEQAEPGAGDGPGLVKRELLAAIDAAPAGSAARRSAFFAMHKQLQTLRGVHAGSVERVQRTATEAVQHRDDAAIAERRDWAFALYPDEMLDELAQAVKTVAACGEGAERG